MEPFKLRISNYRNISAENPLEVEISEGTSFILGVNNIGKSNLLRFLYEFRGVFSAIKSALPGRMPAKKQDFGDILLCSFEHIQARASSLNQISFDLTYQDSKLSVSIFPRNENQVHTLRPMVSYSLTGSVSRGYFEGLLAALTNTLYIGAFRSASGKFESSAPDYDILIGRSFVSAWDSWANGPRISHRTQMELLIDELRDLFGFKKFSIRVSEDKKDLLITNENGTFALDELGGGIAQFIIVLGNALIKRPNFILIDEPETGLHPNMQEVFVRALASKAKYGLMASSHVIGLARSVADKIMSLKKDSKDNLTLIPFGQGYEPRLWEAVQELSYSQFAEIGVNNILLVEGRNDVKCFKEILRKYGIDKNFIVISLSGSEFIVEDKNKILEEMKELHKLNPKSISVIFDSMKNNDSDPLSPKLEAFRRCCEQDLGFFVFPTEFHSTENYLKQSAITEVLGPQYTELLPFEDFSKREKENKWAKDKNWLVLRKMPIENFKDTQLEKFIKDVLIKNAFL